MNLIPPMRNREPIPAIAYNVAAQLLAVEADIDGTPRAPGFTRPAVCG